MLHPVGPLPAAVYWRRRLLVLGGTLGVLTGGGWLGVAVASGDEQSDAVVAASTSEPPAAPPALEQVVPSPAPAAPSEPPAPPAPPGPVVGGPCADDMITVDVRPDPASATVGSKPTFNLVVTNVSPVACVRAMDKGLQEVVLVDGAGNRVWGSNDCYPEASSDVRTLQPGESVVLPVLWSGLGSAPGCAGDRVAPPAGAYVLRGRLDTKTSGDAPFTLT